MNHVISTLQTIKEKGLYRELSYLEAPSDPYTIINGKKVLLMSSNNYLGLCNDERLKTVAINALNKYGVGSGGSRLTTGSYILHKELENKIAEFKRNDASLVFNTGYMANLGVISTYANKDFFIYCDRLNHASIIDGCKLSDAKLVIYKHCNMDDLLKQVKKYSGKPGLIVTDGVFSMDGDIAPLYDIVEIAKQYNLSTMVDDAHATGVLGAKGSGTAEHLALTDSIDINMGTLSKALASEGGFVAGNKNIIEFLRQKAKSFIYSTSLSPQTIAVSLKALEIVKNEPFLREKLLSDTAWFRNELRSYGFNIKEGITPIIPIIIGDSAKAVEFAKHLLNNGIYIPAIRPPTVPKGTSRLRITLMANHQKSDLLYCLENIKNIGFELGVI